MQVRTTSPWQIVAFRFEQPVPAVVPAAGHWQLPTPSGPWQVCTPTQAIGFEAMWQLFGSLVQVCWPAVPMQYVPMPPPDWAAVQVSSHEQAPPRPAPLHVWFAGQAWSVSASAGQVPSVVQFASVPGPLQKVPVPVQAAGAVWHTQDALPATPVHVEFVVQVVEFVALTKRQLLPSVAQVETLAPSQNGPFVVQVVALHAHRPEAPQVWCGPHVVVVCVKQPLPSTAQCTDELPEQESPAAVQAGSATQAQAPTPGLPVQAWFAAQATAVSA
jgi:hypothetical protein